MVLLDDLHSAVELQARGMAVRFESVAVHHPQGVEVQLQLVRVVEAVGLVVVFNARQAEVPRRLAVLSAYAAVRVLQPAVVLSCFSARTRARVVRAAAYYLVQELQMKVIVGIVVLALELQKWVAGDVVF